MFWEKGSTGPPTGEMPPPVDRADPERKKRDRQDPEDPNGPGGYGSSGGKQQTASSLLLQMWQATLRELLTEAVARQKLQ